ncbi:hypothetical protein AK830_g10256 [Neonectria ditissima]|uniref:F-box domain-containing protein n=1 Tax=Neonectria ditissima TaxID=78410 RepID=A0A0P7B7I6_9HYPO|nr:hypothetical protein AK830_g10256 [Neonectria ditissima]
MATIPPTGHNVAGVDGAEKQAGTEECSVQGLTALISLSGRHDRHGNIIALSRILDLPMELQLMTLRYLNFGDLERLRRTCHFFRDNITQAMIRELFPSLKYELLSTCYHCLSYDPLRNRLVRPEETNERYPFASECLECVAKGEGFMVGTKITLGDFTYVWVNVFLAVWAFCLTLVRNEELRTYHFTLFLELAILALWMPPLYAIVKDAPGSTKGFSKAAVATIAFIALNMWFRLLNVLGNVILVSEYKIWRRHRPGLTLGQRIVLKVTAVLVFWTYPQIVEQTYPGKWWFTRRREPLGSHSWDVV